MPVKPSPRSKSPRAAGIAERRREPRVKATGDVFLRQCGVLTDPFVGQLVDTARHGFRARHDRLALACGQVVDFQFGGRSGQARAVWTRIEGGKAETGFHILS